MVEAYGTAYAVAEVGEQFAWLGAALRPSTCESGIASCTPFLTKIQVGGGLRQALKTQFTATISVEIDYTMHEPKQLRPLQGQCWHDMFQNPVVVEGYPIKRRSESDTGLELPLDMMASLMQTRRADLFNGKLFIKGYSAMLVPVRRNGDILLWHHVRSGDRKRILYSDNTERHETNVERFEQIRHIVGWCSEAKLNAGKWTQHHNYR